MSASAAEFPGQFSRRWPDPDDGPFALRVCVGIVDGALSIIGIELYGDRVRPAGLRTARVPRDGMDLSETEFPNVALGETPHRIDAKTLRDLAPGKLLDEWKRTNYEQLSAFLDRFGTAAKASDLGRLLLAGVERDNTRRYRTKRPRKTELDALQWQAVAEVYLDALERGEHPTLAVKEKFNISKSAAAKRVAKCRARGLLPPTSKGRSAGTRKEGTS